MAKGKRTKKNRVQNLSIATTAQTQKDEKNYLTGLDVETLYGSYSQYCFEKNSKPISKNEFTDKLLQECYQRGWHGVKKVEKDGKVFLKGFMLSLDAPGVAIFNQKALS
ncbi:MAG: hypothetical protein KME60_21340 [Cyanomargarita calcarea GSE-NOS-MK-12-04C]|jgi:hypothetical protein|uniref:Uncharacterized protein n=1 Tax=Cyanomargarita calcarea GSE-NOS-MK-12-04C TaxID=2839659 RepID=A0A951UUC7_9CYAN|nr:hypothetical protein [Cyanomargarita calcarea GSE-NOS-MK-12-04C]